MGLISEQTGREQKLQSRYQLSGADLICNALKACADRMLHLLPVLLILSFQNYAYARSRDYSRPEWTRFIATAYSVSGETASQTFTQEGRTLAADPAVLPIGTVVEVRNAGPYSGQYVVQDTGRKIIGRKVDIYIVRTREAMQFGKRRITLRVLKPAPATRQERRKAAAEAMIDPKPPKADRVSDYYQYSTDEANSADSVE